jgi:transposase
MMTRSTKYSPEVRGRAVRIVFEHRGDHASEWAAITSIVTKIGCNMETLRLWCGRRSGIRDCGTARRPTSEPD